MSKNVLTPQEVIQKRINMLNVQIKDAEGKRERVVAMLEEDNIYLRELNTERLATAKLKCGRLAGRIARDRR